MPPHINLQSSTGTPIFFWQLHMKEDEIGEHGTYTTLSLLRVWKGGPDPAFPPLFCENPTSHTFFISFPNPTFLSQKNTLKSLILVSANPVKAFKCVTKLRRSLCSLPLSGTLNFSLGIGEVLALELLSVATR